MEDALPRVFLDLKLGGFSVGTVVIKLRPDLVPKTCYNFAWLCNTANEYNYKNCELKINKDKEIFMSNGLLDENHEIVTASAWGKNDFFDVSTFMK